MDRSWRQHFWRRHGSYASEEESSVASSDLDPEVLFERDLSRVRNNDPRTKHLLAFVENWTNGELEDLGRDISNNSHLVELSIIEEAIDDEQLSSLFTGLSESSSIIKLELKNIDFSAAELRSLEPFLQNSINLRELALHESYIQTEGFNILMQVLRASPIEDLDCRCCGITSIETENAPKSLKILNLSSNDMQSEGFNRLLRSLRDSNIKVLHCMNCGIESIEIINDSLPRKLKTLNIGSNRINSNGCHEIAKLLQGGGSTLEKLFLRYNSIGDEGVATLVDALKMNTTLKELDLEGNGGISRNGHILILKMLNDISSIKSTLQSNHTLRMTHLGEMSDDIRHNINMAISCNRQYSAAAGREKVIQTQLHSRRRAKLAEIQRVHHSLYGEINPLHLPEMLSLVGREHGQEELYVALKASIAELLSTVNRRLCLQQRRAHYLAMVEDIDAEIAAIDSVEGGRDDSIKTRGIKRLRA